MKQYLILPDCSDLNRGDQALVWLTKEMAEEAGFKGEYYMLRGDGEPDAQSIREGLKMLPRVLKHPSRIQKKNENIQYDIWLKLQWGIVAVWDLFASLLLLCKPTRKAARMFLKAETQKTLQIMEACDAVFVKGGGFVHAYGGLTGFYYIYYVLYHILLAQRLGKKVYIMPNSYGPFKGVGVKSFARKVLKKCCLLSARESISSEMTKTQLGVEIETYPDLAFFLQKRENDVSALFKDCGTRKKVAVTMRPYRFPEHENGEELYKAFQNGLHQFLLWIYENGYMPVIVEHTLALNTHENDKKCIEEVTKDIPENYYCMIADRSFDCKDLKNIYSQCDYIVGTRFHSVIFSLSEGIPGIAITYGGNKGMGIMQDMELEELALPIEKVSFEALRKLFLHLLENEQSVKQKISAYLEKSEKKKNELIKKLAEG